MDCPGADGIVERFADCVPALRLALIEAADAFANAGVGAFDAPDLVVDNLGAIQRDGQVDLADAGNIGGVILDACAIGIDGDENAFVVDIFQQGDIHAWKKERFSAAEQQGNDLVIGKLIDDVLPVRQAHFVFHHLWLVADVAFRAPLPAHLAAQVANIGDGQRYTGGEIHFFFPFLAQGCRNVPPERLYEG